MRERGYPRDRVDEVLAKAELEPSYRIIPRRHLDDPLGTAPADSRFCAKADGFTVIYAAPAFATAFIETIVRDRFLHRRRRETLLKEVTERAWVQIESRDNARLTLLDLRQDGCVRLGASTDAVRARNQASGRALGRAIHAEHEDVDGLLFSSRLTGTDVYAIFGRAIGNLSATQSGMLQGHGQLADVLSAYDIRLITT